MDINWGTVIYVIIALIYLYFKNKKKQEKAQRESEGTPQNIPPVKSESEKSIEDWLKELDGAEAYEKPKEITVEKKREAFTPEVKTGPEKIKYVPLAKREPLTANIPSLKEKKPNYRSIVSNKKHLQVENTAESQKDEDDNNYTSPLSTLESAQEAFIASEIFNRRIKV